MSRNPKSRHPARVARPTRRKKGVPPWGTLGDGKPIERVVSKQLCAADPRFAELAEKEARAEQYCRMMRVKEHYGIEGETGWRPWYELALVLAVERDSSLTIIDERAPRTDRTAPRARSAEGLQLAQQIEFAKNDYLAAGEKVPSIIALLREHQDDCERYRHMKLEEFERFYYRAHAYWTSKRQAK